MALTWRNVDAPDFSSSLNGIRTFGNLFGDAVGGLQRGLDRFDSSIDKRVNAEFGMDLLRYQDPAEYKAALASGALFGGTDPRRISAANIAAAGARSSDLLAQSTNELALDRAQYQLGRTKGFDAAKDGAAPMLAAYAAASAAGKGAEFMQTNPGFAKGLSFEDTSNLVESGQKFERGAVDIEGGRISNATGILGNEVTKYNFGNAKIDREEQRLASSVVADILRTSDNPADAEAYIQQRNLTGPVALAVRNAIGLGSLGAGATGSSGGGSAGIGSVDPTRSVNYEARASGFTSVPDTVKTLGDASDFALQINAANKARTGEAGSSAMGTYQIVGSTMRTVAAQVFGKDWKNIEFNQENQDKLAKKIFEDNRGSASALSKQWVSLSPAEAERVRKMPWEQAREIIGGKESSATPETFRIGPQSVKLGIAGARGQQTGATPNDAKYGEAMLDDSDVSTVVNKLLEGPFKGTNRGTLTELVRTTQTKAKSNPALAGQILANSIRGNDNGTFRGLGRRLRGGSPNLGGGVRVDDDLVNSEIKRVGTDEMRRGAITASEDARAITQISQAESNFEAAKAALSARMERRALKPGLSIDREMTNFNRAQAMLVAATNEGATRQREIIEQPAPQPLATGRPARPSSGALIAAAAARAPSRRQVWDAALMAPVVKRGDGSMLRR